MANLKYTLGAGVAAAAVTAVLAATPASADILGSAWRVSNTVAGDATPGNVPGTTPDETFTVNSPLDFASTALPNGYTEGGFVATTGGTVLTGTPTFEASTLDDTLFDFKGSVTVTTGQKFKVGHDDGLTLVIGGTTVINDPTPTAFALTTETWTGPNGTFAFNLVYGECCGAPAFLEVTLPLSAPEPASLALLGTGLAGLGAALRRRRRKTA